MKKWNFQKVLAKFGIERVDDTDPLMVGDLPESFDDSFSEYEADCMVYQSLRGDNNYLTAFAGDEKGIKAIADGFVRSIYGDIESFSYEGTDVSAEVLNVNNGLYVTKLSSVDIKEVSDSPVIRKEKTKITGVKDFYKIPLSVEGAAVDLIICFNNDWTVE